MNPSYKKLYLSRKFLTENEDCLTGKYLTDNEILKFQGLCKKCYNLNLTFEEAREQSTKLAMAFDLMLDNLDTIDNDKN